MCEHAGLRSADTEVPSEEHCRSHQYPQRRSISVDHLERTVADVRRRILRATSRRLNEENTKATLIEPVLRALGWDVEDFDEVQREFRIRKRDKPADYVLLTDRRPRLLIEAKGLGEDLANRNWANQIMGYASVAGVQWIVLTNGNEYRIYNSHAPVDVDEKLFRVTRLDGGGSGALETLQLIAKEPLAANRLEAIWQSHHADRLIGAALQKLFSPDGNDQLLRLVRRQVKVLGLPEVRSSLARCRVSLDFHPTSAVTQAGAPNTDYGAARPQPSATAQSRRRSVTTRDLIDAGILAAPLDIQREYRGKQLSARIELDGRVTFLGQTFDSLSTAAGAARASVTRSSRNGPFPQTNGWTFWRFRTASGVWTDVAAIRREHSAQSTRRVRRRRKAA